MPAAKAPKKTAGKQPTLKQLGKPDYEWFTHDRFGMFIHWGTYAMAARHEWVKSRERIGDREYNKYFELFDPDLYDPAEWARAARYAGMKYFVITTKHHEGFCLWDSKYTDYKATNTPCGRDLIGPMVQAFRAEGLRVGFYHSLLAAKYFVNRSPVSPIGPNDLLDDLSRRYFGEASTAIVSDAVICGSPIWGLHHRHPAARLQHERPDAAPLRRVAA